MNRFWGILIMILYFQPTCGQIPTTDSVYPETGKICPDFHLTGIEDYSLNHSSINGFRGKWLLLDFWERGCRSCVEALPKINEQQKKHADQLQYVLIGREDKEMRIRTVYENLKKSLNLQIPHLYDTALFHYFDIPACPTTVIIDPKGVVYGYTYGLSNAQLDSLLSGKNFPFMKVYRSHERRKPLLDISDLRDNDERLIFRSQLNKWGYNSGLGGGRRTPLHANKGKFETCAANLLELYMLAYFGEDGIGSSRDSLYGKVFGRPVIEFSEQEHISMDSIENTLYCYSIVLPQDKEDRNTVMRIMQNDLKNYFGYNISIEEREMPCWKLTSSDEGKKMLLTKGDTPYYNGSIDTGFIVKNFPIREVLALFRAIKLPIIDETGINGNIDIHFKHTVLTEEEIKKGLKENHLLLQKSNTKMRVLIIHNLPNNHPISSKQNLFPASILST
jgi:thiol-disulfide isomerase/thioredoxin